MNSSPARLFGFVDYQRAFVALLASNALFRLLYTTLVPLTSDELMHWQWARHLALGYPEHPPLIAWLIALNTSVLGTSAWSVRLVSVLAVTGTFWFAFRLGQELFGDRSAFFGAVPLMFTPIFTAGGLLANTDGLLSFFWILSVYLLKKAVLDGWRPAWLLFGVSVGLCLLSKLPAVLLFVATTLFLAGTREGRPWLRRWEPYAAALLAVLFFWPPIVWNMRNDWFTINMRVGHQAAAGFTLKYFGELIGAQLATVTPLLFLWVVWGLWNSWRSRADSRFMLVGTFMAVPFLFYVTYSIFARAGIHWPAIGYVTGFVAAGAFTASVAGSRHAARYLAVACVLALLITGPLLAIAVFPEAVEGTWSYWGRPDKVSSSQLTRNIFDWGELGVAVQEELDRGSEDRFVMCRLGYGLASMVAFYTPERPATFLWKWQLRNGVAYDMWRIAADLRGWDAVIVDDVNNEEWFDELSCCFETLSDPRRVEIRSGGRVVREFYLVRATNFSGFPDDHPNKK